MRRFFPWASGILLAAMLVATQTAAPAPAADDAAHWQDLVHRLADPDPAQRAAAQSELDQTTARDLETLRRLADAATAPEAKSRLAARIEELQGEALAHPPPISLHLKNATYDDLARALTQATGIHIAEPLWDSAGTPWNDRFTIDQTDRPFWEIMLALEHQHAFSMEADGSQPRLAAGAKTWQNGVVSGALAIFPQTGQNANPRARAGAAAGPFLSLSVAMDPRVPLAYYSSPVLTEIKDDRGNDLRFPGPPVGFVSTAPGPCSFWTIGYRLNLPAQNAGQRIASVKGSVEFVVITKEDRIDVPDPEKQVGKMFNVGGTTIKLAGFKVRESMVSLDLDCDPAGAPPKGQAPTMTVDGKPATAAPTPMVCLADGDGRLLLRATADDSAPGTILEPNIGPVKLWFSVPVKGTTQRIDFALKDLPLP